VNPQNFSDGKGREWRIVITGGVARELAKLGFDLIGANYAPSISRFYDDGALQADVIWTLIREQAESASLSKKDVMDTMTGEHFDDARDAVLEAIPHFFGARRSEQYRRLRGHLDTVIDETQRQLTELVEMDEAKVRAALGRAGLSSLHAPPSSASTGEIGPLESSQTPTRTSDVGAGT